MTAANIDPRALLVELFQSAVDAADPNLALPDYLPEDTTKPAIVIGAGKAAASMAATLEQHWRGPLTGLVVTPYGHSSPCDKIEVVEAAHPVPDKMGAAVAQRMLDMVSGLSAEQLVICLISGGGSSLLSLPAPGLTLADKQQINRALLKSGATIGEINCVRKHLSAIKGGRLAAACAPAQLITYGISDVPGDDHAVIASGPTVPDPTTSADALAILKKYPITATDQAYAWLHNPAAETLKPDNPVFDNCSFQLIANASQALHAAAKTAQQMGLTPLVLGEIEGESRDAARAHAEIVRGILTKGQPVAAPCVVLSGGETTVTVRGNGRGGRNAEFLLGLAVSLGDEPGVYALAADTDGIDGSEDNAGALLTPDTWTRAQKVGLSAAALLENNDAYSYFEATDDLLITGPTLTNVNDFRAILILPDNHSQQPSN